MGKKSFWMPIKINIHRTVRTRKKDNHRVHQAQELGYLRHGTNGRLNFFSTERLAKARARFFAASQLHSTTKCPLWNGLLLLAEILSLLSSSSIVPQIKPTSSNWRREECVQVDKKVSFTKCIPGPTLVVQSNTEVPPTNKNQAVQVDGGFLVRYIFRYVLVFWLQVVKVYSRWGKRFFFCSSSSRFIVM